MTLTDDEIQSRIIQFIAGNSGCNVRTMVQALASRLFISPSTISMNYKLMIYDEKISPVGSIIVEKPSGFRGGNEPFKLTLRQTDLKKELDKITKDLEKLGYKIERKKMVSGIHIVYRDENSILWGTADPRREGTAVGK